MKTNRLLDVLSDCAVKYIVNVQQNQ